MHTEPLVLVVDDEPSICWGFEKLLTAAGYRVETASSAEEGLVIAGGQSPALVVLDVRLPGEDGLTALPKFIAASGGAPVVVMTAFGDLETAVSAIHGGAREYLTKPFDLDDALCVCKKALDEPSEPESATPVPGHRLGSRLVGSSPAMQNVYRQIAMVADSNLSVLITGETGTGKELIANAIHQHSPRRDSPYVAIAPVTFSPALIESELFGHVTGAFTGADANRDGLFRIADGGTILLDEIGELPESAQVKLLRVLEQRQFTPVGGVTPQGCDVRILASTNADLRSLASRRDESEKSFREDLFFRLAVAEIVAPPLSDRLQDVPELVAYFLELADHPQAGAPLAPDVLAALVRRPWPGNVRELRNVVEHIAVVSRGRPITVDHLSGTPPLSGVTVADHRSEASVDEVDTWTREKLAGSDQKIDDLYDQFLSEFEPSLLRCVLEHTEGNRAAAASILGMHRGTLRERLRRHGLDG